MMIRLFVFIIFGVFLLNPVYADPSADLAAMLNKVRTMRADFKQTTYDNRGTTVLQSNGNMALERPGKFRWEIKKPIPQTIIANGNRLWIFDPDLEQVTIRLLARAAGESPAMLLTQENASIDKNYKVTNSQTNMSGWQWFTLKPRNSDNMIASVQMGFMHNELHEMRLDDHLGHTTRIQFLNIKSNLSLPDALFVFNPPANVDVIDETKH